MRHSDHRQLATVALGVSRNLHRSISSRRILHLHLNKFRRKRQPSERLISCVFALMPQAPTPLHAIRDEVVLAGRGRVSPRGLMQFMTRA